MRLDLNSFKITVKHSNQGTDRKRKLSSVHNSDKDDSDADGTTVDNLLTRIRRKKEKITSVDRMRDRIRNNTSSFCFPSFFN